MYSMCIHNPTEHHHPNPPHPIFCMYTLWPHTSIVSSKLYFIGLPDHLYIFISSLVHNSLVQVDKKETDIKARKLKSFTPDDWACMVSKWFPHPDLTLSHCLTVQFSHRYTYKYDTQLYNRTTNVNFAAYKTNAPGLE